MNLVRVLKALGPIDARNVRRDSMLAWMAIMPFFLSKLLALFNVASASSNAGLFLVSSAGLLIVVGVVRDAFLNIDAELKLHGYQDSLLVR